MTLTSKPTPRGRRHGPDQPELDGRGARCPGRCAALGTVRRHKSDTILGFGRTAVSEIEAPNILANLV
jgi:hypothetical protein